MRQPGLGIAEPGPLNLKSDTLITRPPRLSLSYIHVLGIKNQVHRWALSCPFRQMNIAGAYFKTNVLNNLTGVIFRNCNIHLHPFPVRVTSRFPLS